MGLNGTLPESLGSLESLRVLNLSWNDLEGPIPESFARLYKLEHLLLNMNNLTGSIPVDLGKQQARLEQVNLAGNLFEGEPPEYMGMCKSMPQVRMTALGIDGRWIWLLV